MNLNHKTFSLCPQSHSINVLEATMSNKFTFPKIYDVTSFRWLRPLAETHNYVKSSLNHASTLKISKKMISEISCFREKLATAYVKKFRSEYHLQETLEYLSTLVHCISKAANNPPPIPRLKGKKISKKF
jgi:hypothetical protein